MPAKRFGKYEVLARIATGGAANIFLARQPGAANFNKLVCLKTLLPERAIDTDFVAMFLDEARLAARLTHPNCVQIYDLGSVHGSYYISMEYIFGETLWNLLATVAKLRVPLPTAQTASIVASACDGLHHAHELKDPQGRPFNLVHRDVSPQNVMISFEGQTKVVDFGIAKAETGRASTTAGIVKGKFSYMSPEQITGNAIDRRSDVFALGIVLFECLASRRLYRAESPEDIAKLILDHRAPRLRDLVPDAPEALDAICATALARNPAKRYQTAQAMGDAIRDYLDTIRYTQNTSGIARLIEERFRSEIPQRRAACEAALSGTYDEAELLRVLDGRVVRDIDLFNDPKGSEGEFVEHLPAGAAERAPPSSPSFRAEAPARVEGQGFRVEIEAARGSSRVRASSVLTDAAALAGLRDEDSDGLDIPTQVQDDPGPFDRAEHGGEATRIESHALDRRDTPSEPPRRSSSSPLDGLEDETREDNAAVMLDRATDGPTSSEAEPDVFDTSSASSQEHAPSRENETPLPDIGARAGEAVSPTDASRSRPDIGARAGSRPVLRRPTVSEAAKLEAEPTAPPSRRRLAFGVKELAAAFSGGLFLGAILMWALSR